MRKQGKIKCVWSYPKAKVVMPQASWSANFCYVKECEAINSIEPMRGGCKPCCFGLRVGPESTVSWIWIGQAINTTVVPASKGSKGSKAGAGHTVIAASPRSCWCSQNDGCVNIQAGWYEIKETLYGKSKEMDSWTILPQRPSGSPSCDAALPDW